MKIARLGLIWVLVAILPAVVQAQYLYTTNNDNTITITGYTGPGGVLAITNSIDGLPVGSIGDYAFQSCHSLTSVTIPESVTNIGDRAFSQCTNLTSVTIPASVTTIGEWAFSWCGSLTGIRFSGNAPSLGSDVFYESSKVAVYYLPGTTGWGATFGGRPTVPVGYAYTNNGDGTCTITGYTGDGGDVTIPNTISNLLVTSIGPVAFYDCAALSSVTIPASVTNIGIAAFAVSASLTNITVDATNAWYSSLDGVLFDKSRSTLIQYPAGATGSYSVPGVASIADQAFIYCEGLTSVQIPSGVTSIGRAAFYYCGGLTNATIADSVTNIGEYAFDSCSGLTAVTIPSSVTYIGRVFGYCTGLTRVTIPEGVTCFGLGTFAVCSSLTSVSIPSTVTNMGVSAFHGTALTDIYFAGNAPGGSSVFYGVNEVAVYYLPGATGWGSAFYPAPNVLWNPQVSADASFGVQTNCFGFTFTNAGSPTVVIEACTNLSKHAWSRVGTRAITNGSSYFGDPQWTNHTSRFYRFRMP